MQAETVPTRNGQFTRMRCPDEQLGTRCHVTYTTEQGQDAFKHYLGVAEQQFHPFYKNTMLAGYLCHCHESLILKMSRSEANPGRLYFSCPWRMCDFFQRGDQTPTEKKNREWFLYESRDSQGYPKRGVDVVPVRNEPILPNFQHTDDALWKECETIPIFLADNSNNILFPRELVSQSVSKPKIKSTEKKCISYDTLPK